MDRDDFKELDNSCAILGITIFIIATPIWLPCLIGRGIYLLYRKLFKRSCEYENPEKT